MMISYNLGFLRNRAAMEEIMESSMKEITDTCRGLISTIWGIIIDITLALKLDKDSAKVTNNGSNISGDAK